METKDDVLAVKIAEIKLRRIEELNARLQSTLQRERIPASSSCTLIIKHVQETPDYLVPYVWKLPPEQNKYRRYQNFRALSRRHQPQTGCCSIV
ncbi:uncharacterized protein CANTADRAFT_7177 [Suhomyces tanzawaensis NRRL Y-17324]|uniref:Guanine nucleotide-binding protein subunit gamma n=1 Tax=Suhomyces tanzawaensis NRRL Y-17324 TaxID=984487 RepID=A0A1E4SH69_9ASCO|nr:uncharacterized protein CANTADRAFT_7177 [Suhomyces tanzawaensis NRRL Y-17324]ODV78854.1 hypothetical protein CANTADRAFT_7177 [Suhomyces tanzawaensis NRRL Y-17324]